MISYIQLTATGDNSLCAWLFLIELYIKSQIKWNHNCFVGLKTEQWRLFIIE